MSRRRSSAKLSPAKGSEVVVQDSPVSSVKQRGNLVGNARIVRDHVVNMSNIIDEWNSQLMSGMKIIDRIKTEMQLVRKSKKTEAQSNSTRVQESIFNLECVCDKMEALVTKLEKISFNLANLHKLEEMNSHRKPLFLTWSSSKFVDVSQQLHEMYRQEMKMKIMVKEEICFCEDENLAVFYETAWFQQPYIDKLVSLSFKAMLVEVGVECSSKVKC